MEKNDVIIQKAVLIGASIGDKTLNDTDDASMRELAELVKTAGGTVVAEFVQNIKLIDPATFIGKGKVEEIRDFISNNDCNLAVFDSELSGSITKNLENELGVMVIDRSRLILDIFAMRAKSKEGKCQVELAQLKYLLPRLSGVGISLSRLGGGIGTRGPGESKLETDKRHIRNRISALSSELKEIEKHRNNLRKKRIEESIPFIALVGYTNVGKSSLLNLLSLENDAYVENKLFATLDPLMRKILINNKTEAILCDTVGFIRKLPHHLIEAFKSTLEEVEYADLIIHVVDASSPDAEREMEVVNELINNLNKNDSPVLTVFNKCDIDNKIKYLENDMSVSISVKEESNIDLLLNKIEEIIYKNKNKLTVLIPYSQGNIIGMLYKEATVLKDESIEDGYLMDLVCDNKIYNKIKEFKYEEL